MKKLLASVGMFALCMSIFFAVADPVTDFVAGYTEGTALPTNQVADYEHTYKNTLERKITLAPAEDRIIDRDGVLTTFVATWTELDGTERTAAGPVMFYLREGEIYHVEYSAIEGFDLAVAGQMADVGSTLIGLAAGGVEANPIAGAMQASPVGILAWVGLKYWVGNSMNDAPLLDCIGSKMEVAQIGWGISAWNLAGLIHPAAGLLAAAIAATYADDRPAAFRACALAKLSPPGSLLTATAPPSRGAFH